MREFFRKRRAGPLVRHLNGLGFTINEGFASDRELAYLAKLAKRIRGGLAAEVGFNAGFSSYALLAANPALHVVSFDIMEHAYVRDAKAFVDARFPGRHTLIEGDSRETVPRYEREHPGTVFDLIFIDGGHEYEIALADITNLRPLAGPHTAVVIDDLAPWMLWGAGPSRAWEEMLGTGVIEQEDLFQEGRPVRELTWPTQSIWAIGRYKP